MPQVRLQHGHNDGTSLSTAESLLLPTHLCHLGVRGAAATVAVCRQCLGLWLCRATAGSTGAVAVWELLARAALARTLVVDGPGAGVTRMLQRLKCRSHARGNTGVTQRTVLEDR
jgi:hypothetical protein